MNLKLKYPKENSSYRAAWQRCNSPTFQAYPFYGGKGVRFLFTNFAHFLRVLGPKPNPSYQVDRIDPRGDYTPSNCRWALPGEGLRRSDFKEVDFGF